jgi:hypothetical protein
MGATAPDVNAIEADGRNAPYRFIQRVIEVDERAYAQLHCETGRISI